MTQATKRFKQSDDGIHRVHFDSVAEMIETSDARPVNGANYWARFRVFDSIDDRYFVNGYTRAEILDAMQDPPMTLVDRVTEIRDRIADIHPPVRRRRKIRRRLEMGDELCPDAFLRRDPNGWSEMQGTMKPKSVVRIGVNMAAVARETAANVLYRGAAAIAIADALIANGQSVEIVGFCHTTGAHRDGEESHHVMSWTVKSSDAPLDIAAAAFATAEIAFYRSVVLAARGVCAEQPICRSMGRSKEMLPEADREGFDCIVDRDITTEAAAIRFVEEWTSTLRTAA